MNVLVVDSKSFGITNIKNAMEELGWQLQIICENIGGRHHISSLEEKINSYIEKKAYDFIFSFNFYPVLAEICHRTGLKYVSWVYDSPLVSLYSYTMVYDTNHVFLFDYGQYEELKNIGLKQVHYLPLASNMLSEDVLQGEKNNYMMQVSFVGSLYNNARNDLYAKFDTAPSYIKGYLEALMDVQQKLYGAYVLKEGLTPVVLKELQRICPYEENNNSGVETAAYIYADYFLARRVTARERIEVLKRLSEKFSVYLFSDCESERLENVKNYGCIDYYDQMPQIFKSSEINLNITLKSIKTGIPLRILDIMGTGGFLLTNYQTEMEQYFTAGEHYDYYSSIEELEEKVQYYLDHKKIREEIAYQGYSLVKENFCYRKRLQEIWNIVKG